MPYRSYRLQLRTTLELMPAETNRIMQEIVEVLTERMNSDKGINAPFNRVQEISLVEAGER